MSIKQRESKYSPYTGVVYLVNKRYTFKKKRWQSYLKKDLITKKKIFLGEFETANLAAAAYNKNAILFYGESAVLNKIINEEKYNSGNPNYDSRKPDSYYTKKAFYYRSLTKVQIIETIKSNTTKNNEEDNLHIIKLINDEPTDFIYKKYLPIWRHHLKSQKFKINGALTYDDILIDGYITIVSELKRGLFNGKYFKSWSNTVLRRDAFDYVKKQNHSIISSI